jgi:hypothetical protein
MYLENRDTKIKKVGDGYFVEFYEDNKCMGVIDYSDHSLYYVEDAVNNFRSGIMTIETIERFNIDGKNQ